MASWNQEDDHIINMLRDMLTTAIYNHEKSHLWIEQIILPIKLPLFPYTILAHSATPLHEFEISQKKQGK